MKRIWTFWFWILNTSVIEYNVFTNLCSHCPFNETFTH